MSDHFGSLVSTLRSIKQLCTRVRLSGMGNAQSYLGNLVAIENDCSVALSSVPTAVTWKRVSSVGNFVCSGCGYSAVLAPTESALAQVKFCTRCGCPVKFEEKKGVQP